MPYKDLQRKNQWEQQHRSKRLARRRELRHIEAARKEAQPDEVLRVHDDIGAFFWFPLVIGGSLAFYDPKLATGTGGLALLVAALYKKGWSWWIAGLVILTVGLVSQWNDHNTPK
jgi:hypothetical protein